MKSEIKIEVTNTKCKLTGNIPKSTYSEIDLQCSYIHQGAKFINIHGQALPASLVLRMQIEILGMITPNEKRPDTIPNNAPSKSLIADPIPVMMDNNVYSMVVAK